jgi:hypothetical protein
MSNFNRWDEYLNHKGKVEDGVTDIHGDKVSPQKSPVNPPGTQGHKPYSASDGTNTKVKETGLGDEGEKDLIFDFKPNEDGKSPAKIPTAEQYNFISTFRKTIQEDPTLLEAVVRDLKRNGMLGQVVGELAEHKETFDHLATIMGSDEYGDQICNKLARSLQSEGTAPPFSEAKPDDDEVEGAGVDEPLMDSDPEDNAGLDDEMDGFADEEGINPEMDLEGEEGMMGIPDEEGLGGENFGIEDQPMPSPTSGKARAMFKFHRAMMKLM